VRSKKLCKRIAIAREEEARPFWLCCFLRAGEDPPQIVRELRQNALPVRLRFSFKVILEDEQWIEVTIFNDLHGDEVKLRDLLQPYERWDAADLRILAVGECLNALAHQFKAVWIGFEQYVSNGKHGAPAYYRTTILGPVETCCYSPSRAERIIWFALTNAQSTDR